jgi:hypothetical protein
MNHPPREENSISVLIERLARQREDLRAVVCEMEAPTLHLCSLLESVRKLEREVHGPCDGKLTSHFVLGLQSHDLFAQRIAHSMTIIDSILTSENRRSEKWIYKATWLGGALIEEARTEYVRGFNEITVGLSELIQAEKSGYLPPESSEIARPMSVSLAKIRGFGKRIREVSNVLEALGTAAFAEVTLNRSELDVSTALVRMYSEYSFDDEKRTHSKVLNLPVPDPPVLQPGDAILF